MSEIDDTKFQIYVDSDLTDLTRFRGYIEYIIN